MKVCSPTYEKYLYLAERLRAADRAEIFALRDHQDPALLADEMTCRSELAWVMEREGKPVAALGATEMWSGVWSIHCFGTDDWPKVAIPLTRFVKTTMLPMLFDDLHAHRLEADSLSTHVYAHRWMELCGARKEAVRQKRGRNGEDFFTYVIVEGVDWQATVP